MRARTIALAAICTARVSYAATVSLEEYLGPQPDTKAVATPIPEGKLVTCNSGMHKGHQVLETRFPVLHGQTPWKLRYNICMSRDAHPRMVEVWPREGMAGIGLTGPWYSGACLDVLIEGQSIGGYRAAFQHIKGRREGVVATWQTPMGKVELTFSCARGDPRLLLSGRVSTAQPRARVCVKLQCFPASFRPPRARFVTTAKRTLEPTQTVPLGRDEWWVFYGDREHDWPMDKRSHGPAALMFSPNEVRRVAVRVGTYPIMTELHLRPGLDAFHVALWAFGRKPNDAALASLKADAAQVEPPTPAAKLVAAPARTLTLDGKPAAAIVTRVEPPALVQHAATELAEILFEMSGADLPVVVDKDAPTGNRILLGHTSLTPATDVRVTPDDPGPEGFRLKTVGRDVVVLGSDPAGTLFAAYELLERLGWRCYVEDPVGMVIPRTRTVETPELDVTDKPDFAMRWIGRGAHSFRIRGNTGRRGLPPGFDVRPGIYHAMYRYFSPKDYFETHPEWFALYKGRRKLHDDAKPCTTAPEAACVVAGNMRKLLAEHPGVDLVSLAFKDGASYCQCPRCNACREKDATRDQTFSRLALLFYNAVASQLVRTHPDAKILAGSYHIYNRPPKDTALKAHPALSLVLCHYTNYCLMHPVTDPTCPKNAAYKNLLADWQKLIPDVYFYEYYYTDGWCGLPCPLVHTVREDIPYFHKIGCKGLYTQYGSVWNTFLTTYVASRLLWDVDTDVDALLEDFYHRFFGAAHAPMRAYFEALDRATAATDQHLCTCSMGGRDPRFLFTDDLRAKLRQCLAQAKAAAKHRMVQARLAKLSTALDYTERYCQYWAMVTSARKMVSGPERSRLAADALAHLQAIKDDIAAHPLQYKGIVSLNSYHWRYAPRPAQRLGGHRALKHGKALLVLPRRWRFALDKANAGLAKAWQAPSFDDSKWAWIESGRYWEDQGYPNYDGVAWYRTTLDLAQEQLAGPLALAFGGVDAQATVYVNGRKLIEREGWDTPFLVSLPKGSARPGKNSVAVRVVDNSNNGGMYGEVKLVRP